MARIKIQNLPILFNFNITHKIAEVAEFQYLFYLKAYLCKADYIYNNHSTGKFQSSLE